MQTIEPIDIQKLLTELNKVKGLSDDKIAKELDTTGATVCRLRTGVTKTTNGNRTIAIANFHAKVFKQK